MASTLRPCRLDTAHPCGSRIRHENETGSFATPVRQTRTPWSADRRSPRTLRPDTNCIRCRARRSVRIDARNGDRLGGYDYNDAPGYLLKGGGPADGRRAVGIAAR
jgi:hypothetical protein